MLHIWRGSWNNRYLSNVEAIGLSKRVYTKVADGFDKIEQIIITVSKNLLCQAHKYVLNISDKVQPYINDHMDYIRRTNPTKSRREKWVIDEQNKLFIKWFWNRVTDQLTTRSNYISENLRWLAHGPHTDILFYRGYPTNDYYFYTKARNNSCDVQTVGWP